MNKMERNAIYALLIGIFCLILSAMGILKLALPAPGGANVLDIAGIVGILCLIIASIELLGSRNPGTESRIAQ